MNKCNINQFNKYICGKIICMVFEERDYKGVKNSIKLVQLYRKLVARDNGQLYSISVVIYKYWLQNNTTDQSVSIIPESHAIMIFKQWEWGQWIESLKIHYLQMSTNMHEGKTRTARGNK